MDLRLGHRLRLRAQSLNLEQIRDFCRGVLHRYDLDQRSVRQLVLAVDEAVSNIIEHAYNSEPEDVQLGITVDGPLAVVEIRDRGKPFDPANSPNLDSSHGYPRRGYGIPLIRRIVDRLRYERSSKGENILTLTKNVGRADQAACSAGSPAAHA